MKIILGALSAFVLATALLATPAQARCWWTPYGLHCWHPHPHWHRPYWHHPYWHHPHWHHHHWHR